MSMFNCVNHVTVFRNNCAKYVARKKNTMENRTDGKKKYILK